MRNKVEESESEFGEISNFKLKQSVLTPQGPLYSDLEEIDAT